MINIVFIDDRRVSINAWKTDLKNVAFKFEISVFNNPLEALDEIERFGNNTIIVLDMSMPQINGDEFLHRIRNHNIHIPVIIYSGNVTLSDNNREKFNQLIKDNVFSYINRGEREELVKTIEAAVHMISNAIPLELSEALHEYLQRHPNFKDIKVFTTGTGTKISLQEIEYAINRNTKEGVEYAKSLYKMSFEDLIKGK